jgi:hypothetical protein
VRTVLRLLGTRYGAAVALVVLIALVIGVGKIVGGSRPDQTALGSGGGAVSSAASPNPSQLGDDGVGSPPTPPPPSTSPGASDPQTVALNFTQAWLHHDGVTADQWLATLRPYATKALQDRLSGVDPLSVPASKVAGAAAATDRSPSYVDVVVPLDAGVLTLGLASADGRWLVDSVDWQRP